MKSKGNIKSTKSPNNSEKNGLHPRNPHRFRYDFEQLISSSAELSPYVFVNQYNNETIDFANPDAVKTLNKAILKHFYAINLWDIPKNYLCPPIPGRADYIHYIADLLASCNNNLIPTGKSIKILDIGIGANCVYPIIGQKEYAWQFVGTDIDPIAIKSAKNIIDSNPILAGKIECRLQESNNNIFKGIIIPNEAFDVSICNPPFHSSLEEATAGTQRKLRNLGNNNAKKPILNFGGQNSELWCEGGEEAFVCKMIRESATIPNQCFWFTSLISKKEHLQSIYHALRQAKAFSVRTIKMTQGQKNSRIVAWTFLNETQQKEWQKRKWK
ncbi:Ribosomal RNA large subunit methyltransferase F [Emticicia aquatica]|jgi:23S rRNA (adenine1618-N6)-methyltransferase|uniref:Ribosomal RNA large subunit methyltransferase F n=1 Tax=Emticicia aquatica TaxID=1681835 RepID=A0ABM9ANY5_9BACT|nr:23S rRNA (adenine(1618)-N(6))-methyltransferase RlmF [Emticicia aquatica]CAH0995570.1 Ribosomal RNA large subunit methyltransferase F [Emticicia aquatica]